MSKLIDQAGFGTWGLPRLALLAGLLAFSGVWIALVWLDSTPLVFDRAGYYVQAQNYREIFADGFSPRLLQSLADVAPWRPPLPSLVGAAILGMGTANPDALATIGLVAALACAIFVYRLGLRFAGEYQGLTAAALVLSVPIVAGHSRIFMMDLPLTALTLGAVSLVWLIGTREGSTDKQSWMWLWLGLYLAAGQLTKLVFPFFVVGPMVFELVAAAPAQRIAVLRQFVYSIVLAAILVLPWYWITLPRTISFYRETGHFSATMDGQHVLSLSSLATYARTLVNDQLGYPLFVFICIGVALAFWRRPKGARKLLVAAAVPFALFLFVPLRTPRATIPILPFLVLAAILGFSSVLPSRSRRPAVLLIVLFAVANLLGPIVGGPLVESLYPQLAKVDPPGEPHLLLIDLGILRAGSGRFWTESVVEEIQRAGPETGLLLISCHNELDLFNHLLMERYRQEHRGEFVFRLACTPEEAVEVVSAIGQDKRFIAIHVADNTEAVVELAERTFAHRHRTVFPLPDGTSLLLISGAEFGVGGGAVLESCSIKPKDGGRGFPPIAASHS